MDYQIQHLKRFAFFFSLKFIWVFFFSFIKVFLWVTELADQGKMDDSTENSTVPKIVIEQTPFSSAHSDDSGLGGESNATMDGNLY